MFSIQVINPEHHPLADFYGQAVKVWRDFRLRDAEQAQRAEDSRLSFPGNLHRHKVTALVLFPRVLRESRQSAGFLRVKRKP
jgi:hypothetical protein